LITAILILVGAAGVAFFLWSPTWLAPEEWYAEGGGHDAGDP
jgi:hypothetical protein